MNQCYKCKYREDVPGDAHSQCGHPVVKEALGLGNEFFLQLITAMTLSGSGMMKLKGLDIKGNQHGIDNGWFAWPFNFDPVWLEECSGFTDIKEDKKEKQCK